MFKFVCKLALVALLFSSLLGGTGCASSNTSTYMSNHKINEEKIVKAYEDTVVEAKKLGTLVLDGVMKDGNLESLKNFMGSNVNDEKLKGMLGDIKEEVRNKCIETIKALNYSSSETSEYIPSEEEVSKMLENVYNSTDTYYFLDKESGTVEQLFVIRLNTENIKLSVNWLGGLVYDYSYEIR